MRGFFVLFTLFLSSLVFAAEPRIVAIGDIHGDLNSFQSILQEARLADGSGNWNAGNTIFVQTGDAIDRGSQGKQVLDTLMKLEQQARSKGGRVLPLLGNHEVMVMMHDWRYVPPAEFANFADQHSEKRLKDAFNQLKQFKISQARDRKQQEPVITPEMEQAWFKSHPNGFLELMDAYGPSGKYGKWLRKHDAVVNLQKNLFVHGGIGPKIAGMSPSEINDRIRKEIQLFDRLHKAMVDQKVILPFFSFEEMIDAAKEELGIRTKDETLEAFLGLSGWLSVYPEGPLWFRFYAQWTDEEVAASLPGLLETYKASRFIVGHTVVKDGQIHSRQNSGILLIDTGMNRAFYPEGSPSALEIQGEKLTAIYPGKQVPLNP